MRSGESAKAIGEIQMTLLHETSRSRREALLDQLFTAEQLLSRVRNTSPLLDSAARPKPVPLRTLQAALGSDEMLLEYVLGEDKSYLLQITRTDAAVAVLPVGRKRIEDLVGQYLAAVRSRWPETAVAKELFSLLLQPVKDLGSKERLVIIADDLLHVLPIDGLGVHL
jgi:hypothetical protein